jgi:hypothetical protein
VGGTGCREGQRVSLFGETVSEDYDQLHLR